MSQAFAGAFPLGINRLALCVAICLIGFSPAPGQNPPPPAAPPVPAELKAPAGFKVSVFASDVTNGRLMAVSPDGVLYVARQSKGDVVALPDHNKDGKADQMEIVASGLTRPHSLAFNKGYLYIATNPSILRMKGRRSKAFVA